MSQVTLRRLKLIAGVFVVIVIVGAILFYLAITVPVTPWIPLFVVLEDVQVDPMLTRQKRMLPMDVAAKNRSKDYFIYEGELYLKVLETRNTRMLTEVKSFDWPQRRLDQLVSDHPELEVYVK